MAMKKWTEVGYVVCPKDNIKVYICCDGKNHKARLRPLKLGAQKRLDNYG